MSPPPKGTSVLGPGRHTPIPPDHYSPKSCANCHGSAQDSASVSDFEFFAPNPDNLAFLPSPSDCSAEIFWPDSLKTYRGFVQQNPYLRSQNYIETMLASRNGSFPLEVTDSSLGVYLGMKAGSALPEFPKLPSLQIDHDATVCTGPLAPGKTGPEACQPLELEWQSGDAHLSLEGLELLSAQDLEISAQGFLGKLPGAKAKGVTIREGKLLLSVQLGNRFWNAALPLAFPLPGVTVSPNPLDPKVYDVDLTPLVLKKLPVAYRPEKREAVSYEAYQADPAKNHWKVLPYFLNIARAGRLPDRLSMNEVYAAVSELRANTDPAKKEEDPAQKAILEKLLDKLAVSAHLHPRRLLSKNLYVEFAQDEKSNLFRTDFRINQLKDWEVEAIAPVRIDRLFSPGLIDLAGLKGDLGVYLHRQNTSQVALDNLEIDLGHLEYLRTDPDKPGLFATLSGRILSSEDFYNNYLLHKPAISIIGDANGADVQVNLKLENVALRLPQLGKVTISGDLHGQVRMVPKIETETLPNGEIKETKRWVIEPHSLNLTLSKLDLRTESGIHWQDAELEISDQDPYGTGMINNDPGYLSLRFRFPKIEGGHFSSFTIEGGLGLVKGMDGLYDLEATLRDVATQFTLKAQKHDGLSENWVLNIEGNHFPESSVFGASMSSIQFDAAGKVKRKPVENLVAKFDREVWNGKTFYGFHLNADRVDFDRLDLSKVKFGFGLMKEEPTPGVIRWSVPELDISANASGWSKKGWI
ncbi:MAG TPA: hypothetical protein VJP40_03240, partial [bacterium]|nr:hypothetical protein [bacterium]